MPAESLLTNDDAPPNPAEVSSAAPQAPPQSYGRAVGRGFSWLSLTFIAGKAFSFIAQIALGILLLDEDFGVFAIATSVATFAKVFQDGGIAQLLIQRGPQEFKNLAGPGFWMGLAFSAGAAVLLATAAPIIGTVYGNSELTILLWIVAASLPLAAPAQVQRAKLRMDLEFRALAMIGLGSYAIRHLGAVLLAYLGFGARSFVLPLLAIAIFEDAAMYAVSRAKLWQASPNWRLWPELFTNSAWVIAASLFAGLALYGDYLVLGLYLSKSVLGQYFFGYQLTVQVTALMSVNLQYVLLPVLSRLADNPARQAAALMRTIRVLILVVSPLSIALALVIEPLETLVWRNKWAAAVPLMQIFAVTAPLRLFTTLVHAMLTSRGRFQLVAWLVLAEGISLMAAAGFAYAVAGPNLTLLALYIAVAQVLFNLALTAIYARSWEVGIYSFFASIIPGWGTALLSAALVIFATLTLPSDLHPFWAVLIRLAAFGLLFMAFVRSLYANLLIELVAVVPKPIARAAARLLLLRPEADHETSQSPNSINSGPSLDDLSSN